MDRETQLRGSVVNPKSSRKLEDKECIGGMVRAARAVASLPGNLVVGGQVRKILIPFWLSSLTWSTIASTRLVRIR